VVCHISCRGFAGVAIRAAFRNQCIRDELETQSIIRRLHRFMLIVLSFLICENLRNLRTENEP
jgi:hypothetical protein